jgi:hypothetical protein
VFILTVYADRTLEKNAITFRMVVLFSTAVITTGDWFSDLALGYGTMIVTCLFGAFMYGCVAIILAELMVALPQMVCMLLLTTSHLFKCMGLDMILHFREVLFIIHVPRLAT